MYGGTLICDNCGEKYDPGLGNYLAAHEAERQKYLNQGYL